MRLIYGVIAYFRFDISVLETIRLTRKCNYFSLNGQIIQWFSNKKHPPPKKLHTDYQFITIYRIEDPIITR